MIHSKVTSSEGDRFHFIQISLSPSQRALLSCLKHLSYLHCSQLLGPPYHSWCYLFVCLLSLPLKGKLSRAVVLSHLVLYPQNLDQCLALGLLSWSPNGCIKGTKLIFRSCLYSLFWIIIYLIVWVVLQFTKCFHCPLLWSSQKSLR